MSAVIAVCIRIHKTERWRHARAQYERQLFKDRCLVVIANGCEVDTKGIKGKVEVRRHDKPLGYGLAAQACLDAARELDAEMFTIMDAGDVYLPGHVDAVVAALGPHDDRDRWDGCGIACYRIKTEDGELLQHKERSNIECTVGGMLGGTLGGWTDTAVPFAKVTGYREDLRWCRDMRAAGLRLWGMDPGTYLKIPHGIEASE